VHQVGSVYKIYRCNMEWSDEGKAVPLQAWTGPEVSRRLRLPDFKTIGTRRWYCCQPYAQRHSVCVCVCVCGIFN